MQRYAMKNNLSRQGREVNVFFWPGDFSLREYSNKKITAWRVGGGHGDTLPELRIRWLEAYFREK
jgi:hypothetical protein